MKNTELIKKFYRDYQRMHGLIEEQIKENKDKTYLASRILDRIIIFIFIRENMMSKDCKIQKLNEANNVFEEIINFYKFPEKYVEVDVKINTVIKLFKITEGENDVVLSNEVLEKILFILSKYNWSLNTNKSDEFITPDLLGKVFEKYINQKESGAYYTEDDTIEYINNTAIIYSLINTLELDEITMREIFRYTDMGLKADYNVEELIKLNVNLKNFFIEFICKTSDLKLLTNIEEKIRGFSVMDITCGTGAFLVNALELLQEVRIIINERLVSNNLAKPLSSLEIVISIIESNLYGVDIMNDAIEIAKFRMYLKVLTECINNSNQSFDRELMFNLKVGNVLVGAIDDEGEYLKLDDGSDFNKIQFNWKEKFPQVMNTGGFDCIIGNPPYVEYSKIRSNYTVSGFSTLKAGNIYAYVMERAVKLLKPKGVMGVIVPLSIISTPRMKDLRIFLKNNCTDTYISNFGDRPGTLFNGVHQKVSIVIARIGKDREPKLYTTSYYHWYKDERGYLFENLRYIENSSNQNDYYLKLGSELELSIIKKMKKYNKSLFDLTDKNGKYSAYLNTRLTFWVKSFYEEKISNEFKKYNFDDDNKAKIFVGITNSTLYYFIWECISDGWHITNKELQGFNFDYQLLSVNMSKMICDLVDKLEKDLEDNKVYIGSKQTEYEYRHKKSKLIIDQIDEILADYYGFTPEEIKYIKNYQLKYRMNDELENYLSIVQNI